MKKKLAVLQDKTCFSLHKMYNISCQRKKCKNWVNNEESNNCIIVSAMSGPKTLQEIGKIYNLTRMRICQIEKNVYEKIKHSIIQD